MLQKIWNEIKNHPFVYLVLTLILLGATYVRLANTREILGFYYDQGRDALVIWNFIHKGNLFLIGPTTGIEGILRGPWYYWLITPFYFLGGGNPVWPANFLALTTVGAIFILYILGKEIVDRPTGLIAAAIASFSYYLIVASRWLSNPTPMLLISMLLVLSMLMVTKGKKWAWVSIAALLGLAMQFGSATEAFYIPAVVLFAFWQRKNLPSKKIFWISTLTVFLIFLPQIIFDILKGGILSKSVIAFLFQEDSFKFSFWEILKLRLTFYWDMFSSKIWIGQISQFVAFSIISLLLIAFNFKNLWKKDGFRIIILLGISPLIAMVFFQGNEGNVFDYYFTGYYLIYILIFSIGLGLLMKNKIFMVLIPFFFYLFFQSQIPTIQGYLTRGRSDINLKEQLQAIDWIYKDAKGKEFNVDVYVPPVIPFAYDYLFIWRGNQTGINPSTEQVRLLYTLQENDYIDRLTSWFNRQDTIGKTIETVSFRGISVNRRERFVVNE